MFLHADDYEKIIVLDSFEDTIEIIDPVNIEATFVDTIYHFEISYLSDEGYLRRVYSNEYNTRFIKKDELP